MKIDDHLPIEGAGREELKMFYTWTVEDAMRAQAIWERTGQLALTADSEWTAEVDLTEDEDSSVAKGPLFRWDDALRLKTLGDKFMETGDKAAILEALAVCALSDLPIPKWCSMAYLNAYRSVRQYRAKSWDDAFGKPHPKNAKIEQRRDKREKSIPVYRRAEEMKLKNPKESWEKIYKKVGAEFGIGLKLTEKYHLEIRAQLRKY